MDQFKGLSKEKKVEAANIITSTQELLGNGTLIAIGLDPQSVQLSQSDVLGIIGEYKESGNLDASQEAKIVTLATDAKVRVAINNKQLVELPDLEEGLGSGSHLLELGWLLGVVPKDQLENLPPIAISMVEARSVNNIGNLDIFEPVQLERLSPHAASIIRRDQFGDYLDLPQRRALRASGGQDPDLMRVLDAYGIEMQQEDTTREKDVITPRREASRESGSGAVAGSFVILLISFCITKNSM